MTWPKEEEEEDLQLCQSNGRVFSCDRDTCHTNHWLRCLVCLVGSFGFGDLFKPVDKTRRDDREEEIGQKLQLACQLKSGNFRPKYFFETWKKDEIKACIHERQERERESHP